MVYAPGMNPELPEYEFYAGEEKLRFDQSSWTYYRISPDGTTQKLYGVTGICHIIDKSEALMRWAVKKALEKTKLLLSKYDTLGQISIFSHELDKILEEAKKADEQELQKAADTGHAAHEWIEQLIKAIVSDNEERRLELLSTLPEDPRAANCCIAAVQWMSDHNVQWIATERKVFSRTYLYAGTMDGLARVSSCSDPACCPEAFVDRLTLVDWKTSNYLYIEYLLQTAAYKQAFEEETGEQIEDRWVIRLGKDDAEFDPWHVFNPADHVSDFLGFERALALYQSVEELNDRVAAIRRAKSEILKERACIEKEKQMRIECPKAKVYKGKRKSACFDDGTQCQACAALYEKVHNQLIEEAP